MKKFKSTPDPEVEEGIEEDPFNDIILFLENRITFYRPTKYFTALSQFSEHLEKRAIYKDILQIVKNKKKNES